MKQANLLKYGKLGAVLLIDAVQVWAICMILFGETSDSDFVGFGLLMMYAFLVAFNIWALVIYFLTKLIRDVLPREVTFYLLLLLFLGAPLVLVLM